MLALSFPNLRVLWSRSPHETPSIFLSLMQGHEAVDVHKATNAGVSSNASASAPGVTSTSGASQLQDVYQSESRLNAQEMLLSLPGK